jgi:flagellar hook-associated protein 3 FlgL
MAILPLSLARVSNQLQSSVALSSIVTTQRQLLEVQNQIATGKRVNVGSDDPGAAAIIQQLQKTLEYRDGFATNLKQAGSQLSSVDTSLGDLSALLQQAQTLASANVGTDVTNEQRQGAATVVKSLINQALSIGNKQFGGVYLFAGDRSTAAPFDESGGAIRYVGSPDVLSNTFDEHSVLPFMVDGEQVFGALTTQVAGTVNLSPSLTATTRLIDVAGAAGGGVNAGSIRLGNGVTTIDIDLSKANSLGDIVNTINASGLSGVTASIGTTALVLSGAGNISVNDVAGGTTAADLGILTPAGAGAGIPVNGLSLAAQVTPLTRISNLRGGAGLDTSGLTITNGGTTVNLSFAGAQNVQDMLNVINGSKAGVLARINAAGTGIDIVNPTQGAAMTISENGGLTASQLGVRSMTAATKLADLNGGKGVRTATGTDMQVTRRDGTTFAVDVDGLQTVQDVINAINTADGGGGVTAAFATNGNGIVLADSTGGAGALQVTALNASSAAADLGLLVPAAGNTLSGSDVNPVKSTGIFANLAKLRDALQSGDQQAITESAQGLQADYTRVVSVRGQTGSQVKEIEDRQGRLDDENIATKSLLSNLQDTDFTEAITRFQSLQTSLQAGYLMTSKVLHLSLMDFLG